MELSLFKKSGIYSAKEDFKTYSNEMVNRRGSH
jgi:hypothetical protein